MRRIGLLLCLLVAGVCAAQVGINTTTPRAALDIDADDMGLIIPTVELTALTTTAPVTNPTGAALTTGTLVFHDGSNGLSEGFYYWDSSQWVILRAGAETPAWVMGGNTGTPATAFVGTTDNQKLTLATNNTERVRVSADGLVGVNVNPTLGRLQVNEAAARSTLHVDHSGNNNAIPVVINSTAFTGIGKPGLAINSSSRGAQVVTTAASSDVATVLLNQGTGRTLYAQNTNATSNADLAQFFQDGLGGGSFVGLANTANASIGDFVVHDGLGIGRATLMTNAANTSSASVINQGGSGQGQAIVLTSNTNDSVGQVVQHDGIGTGQAITMGAAATQDSMGQLIVFEGTATGGSGGGNALEVQHNGTNGNAVEVFIGDPAAAAGPANTTNSYAGLTITHMATGTSGATNTKSALTAVNNSADPVATFTNQGPSDGDGINVFATPTTAASALAAGTYSQNQANGSGNGIGVWGQGGNYGVVGATGPDGATVGVFSANDFQAVGVKSFIIDHPDKPATHNLVHYAIESDEVLNMYRGIVKLDAAGKAIVELPSYFENNTRNPTYQLTAIGTSVQPYVQSEIQGNQFVVGGQPNTKVSWTVHAQRYDPTIRYFQSVKTHGYDAEQIKPSHMQGKYLTPAAYGQPEEMGVFYREPAPRVQTGSAKDANKIKSTILEPAQAEVVKPSPIEQKQ